MDDKQSIMGIMEALEFRLKRNVLPKRSLYIAFGHDEEIQGNKGARYIAQRLQERGVSRVEFLLDEGTMVTRGIFPFVNKPVAMISIAEKGSLTVELTMDSAPTGHSSVPPKETNIGVLARAISKYDLYQISRKMESN
ncbi:N-fatty-acyl-amino acid synthase/hydrolase PM20D1-like [Anneissia japonica]|uniref:N-fatty-acyl-amino acid synthase/hydrolase PM20D1-like n=1 Tax=Anneissia japonica TaxID=1529436 RepID=UPI0014255826|nr:N-fatty-acyl-amino acid synthase/hydrolase PM20D1-like [Anneissia japonica]